MRMNSSILELCFMPWLMVAAASVMATAAGTPTVACMGNSKATRWRGELLANHRSIQYVTYQV